MFDQAQALRDIMKARHTPPSIRVITVTSAKGGVGKTSTSINLAIALNKLGRRTLIVDMDLGLANVDVMLGAKTDGNLLSVIHGGRSMRDIIGTGVFDVKFISGGSGMEEMLSLDEEAVQRIITELTCLEDVADTIIFDTSAGLSENAMRLIRASHETILVTTPEPTAVVDAYALLKIVHEQGDRPHISLVVNQASGAKEAMSVADGFIRIAEKNLNIRLNRLGHITRDANMQSAIRMQVPILVSFPKSLASADIRNLTERYLNLPVREARKLGVAGFLESFFSKSVYRET